MPVNAPLNLKIEATGFGCELTLFWDFPSVLPSSYKTYVFRRNSTEPTDLEIASYFANIENLANYNYNGLMVFDDLESPEINALFDYRVYNDITYHYKVVIRDEVTKEYSEPNLCKISGVPQKKLKVNVKDGKKIVTTAITKMFQNLTDADGRKVNLAKDIKIVQNFAIEQLALNYVMIERVNGSSYQQFWGQQYKIGGSGVTLGDYDIDVIRATYLNWEVSDRRDRVANIFRANKFFLIWLIKALGAVDVKISIEGDYYNPALHGADHTGFSIIFNLIIENRAFIPDIPIDEITTMISVMEE